MPTPEMLNVDVTVTNTGDNAGDDVVQVFATRDGAPVIYPYRRLAGFERISLDSDESQEVQVSAPLSTLVVVPGDIPDENREPVVVSGEYTLHVGDQQTSFTLHE